MTSSVTDWLMVGITVVYVIATIFICIANIKSAKETRKQTAESKRQFEESNRAFVTVTFDVIRSGLIALQIKNNGKRVANDVRVKIAPEFVDNIPNKLNKDQTKKLNDASFSLGIGQSFYVCLGGHLDLKQMASELLSVEIDYRDTVSEYHETIAIDMTQYFWLLLYESPTEDVYQEIAAFDNSVRRFSTS